MAQVREVLRAHLVPDIEAPGNLSIHVGTESGNVRGFHFLYRGSTSVVRTRSLGRLLRATIAHLDGFDADPAGTVRLNARLLTDGRGAVVIDASLGATVQRIERRLELLGYRAVDSAGVVIDRTTLEVLTWPPRLEFDRDALAAVERADDASEDPEPAASLDGPIGSARLPIRLLVLGRTDADPDNSPSALLVRLMGLVVSPDLRSVSADMIVAQRLLETGVVRASVAQDAALLATITDRLAS